MEYDSPFGRFTLLPLHPHPKSPLQAWSAADDLLLKELASLEPAPQRIPVNHQQPVFWKIID